MDAVTLETAQGWARRHETALRALYPAGELPDAWEAELQEVDATTPDPLVCALRRWAIIKAFFRERHQEEQRRTDPAEAQEAVLQLLHRDPIRVQLGSGRVVSITGRSISALVRISSHARQLVRLQGEVRHVEQAYVAACRALGRIPEGEARAQRLRRHARRLEKLAGRYSEEILYHRQVIWAHATTPTGAPFGPEDPPPPFLGEITPEDDARLLQALFEVGPARLAKAVEVAPKKPDVEEKGPSWGWEALPLSYGLRYKVPPAETRDVDLGFMTAAMLIGAPEPLEELSG